MGSITSANAIFTISVASIFPTPITLQGFAADDVFDTDPLDNAEVRMGVDGILSAGFRFVPVHQMIALQPDSAQSNNLFDQWYAQEQASKEKFQSTGVVILPAVALKWDLKVGFLTTYPPIPKVARVLEPRRFGITWQAISPAAA